MTKAELQATLEELRNEFFLPRSPANIDALTFWRKFRPLIDMIAQLPDDAPKQDKWPKVGDKVWFAADNTAAFLEKEDEPSPYQDKIRRLISHGNAFRTSEEALREARITATWRKLRKASRESLAKCNDNEVGYYFHVLDNKTLHVWSTGFRTDEGRFYFASNKDIEKAIKSIGEAAIIELLTDGRVA